MSGVQFDGGKTQSPRGRKTLVRIVMRIVMPSLMVGFAAFTVANAGLQGLVALLPILAAHVVGFVVIFPLWVRYRQRRATATAEVSDGS